MPKADSTAPIDTRCFGVAAKFCTPKPQGISDKPGLYKIEFDTGVILYVPGMMFDDMIFGLPEQ